MSDTPIIRRVPPVNPRDRKTGSFVCLTHYGGIPLDAQHMYDHLVSHHNLTGIAAAREIGRASEAWQRGEGLWER